MYGEVCWLDDVRRVVGVVYLDVEVVHVVGCLY